MVHRSMGSAPPFLPKRRPNSTGLCARRRLPSASKRRGSRLRSRLRPIADYKTFTWEPVGFSTRFTDGHAKKPGTLTPLVGAYCASETTCLDILAQRKHIDIAESSNILVDGAAGPLGNEFARGTTYAEQTGVYEGTTAVREATRFSACLRQLYHVLKDRVAYIEEFMEPLVLQPLADATVFSLSSSLSSLSVPFRLLFRSPSCSIRS